jgi:hypothetical protein
MSKMLLLSVIILTQIGPATAGATEPVMPQRNTVVAAASDVSELAGRCRAEAQQTHNVGVFPRRRPGNSVAVRRHSLALIKFCDAYEGKSSREFWDQISASKEPSERQETFLRACLSQANGGRSTVFKPARQHIERMSSICEEMSEKLPSE